MTHFKHFEKKLHTHYMATYNLCKTFHLTRSHRLRQPQTHESNDCSGGRSTTLPVLAQSQQCCSLFGGVIHTRLGLSSPSANMRACINGVPHSRLLVWLFLQALLCEPSRHCATTAQTTVSRIGVELSSTLPGRLDSLGSLKSFVAQACAQLCCI